MQLLEKQIELYVSNGHKPEDAERLVLTTVLAASAYGNLAGQFLSLRDAFESGQFGRVRFDSEVERLRGLNDQAVLTASKQALAKTDEHRLALSQQINSLEGGK